VVAYFVAKGKRGNAFGIIEAHLQAEQTLLPLVYPVTTEACPRRCPTTGDQRFLR
jgi:precorrin-2 C20-methyltransferase (EC 2.1.1.130)/cobalt-factor II C20-methyltransferase (EC 2.1.1.151)